MRAALGLVAALGVLLGGAQGAGAEPATCSGTFTGTATVLVVPADGYCDLEGATVTRDVIVGGNAVLLAADTSVGRNITAQQAATLLTGVSGPVHVGHNITFTGSNAPHSAGLAICSTTIGHDLRVSGTVLTGVLVVGDTVNDFCYYSASPANSIGHDLVVTNNFAYEFIDVGNNTVGHNLVVSGNTTNSVGNYIDVSDNVVGRDARCSANTPTPTRDDPDDGPNQASHTNTCG